MSVWTAPVTWVNAAVTAATMNTEARDHLNFLKGALDLMTEASTADAGTATYMNIIRAAATEPAYLSRITGDSVQRLVILASGNINWSSGAAQPDTRLTRTGAGTLVFDTNNDASLSSLFYIKGGGSATAAGIVVQWISSGADAMFIGWNGALPTIEFGGGSVTRDTNLYRGSANRLMTDDHLQAVDGVATKVKAGTPVDGDWAVAPPVGTLVVDTTGNKIWARTAAATWKGVTIA